MEGFNKRFETTVKITLGTELYYALRSIAIGLILVVAGTFTAAYVHDFYFRVTAPEKPKQDELISQIVGGHNKYVVGDTTFIEFRLNNSERTHCVYALNPKADTTLSCNWSKQQIAAMRHKNKY